MLSNIGHGDSISVANFGKPYGQFVKDGSATILYVDMTADMLEFRLSAIDNTGLFTGMKTTFVFFKEESVIKKQFSREGAKNNFYN